MKRIAYALILLVTFACAQEQEKSQNLSTQIDALIEKDMYTDALTILEGQDASEEVKKLTEKVHLNYGMHLEYYSQEPMSVRMNGALAQFIEVLKINPNNEKAITEIEQILGVYSTFSDRSPNEAIVAELKELGFQI